MALKYIHFTIIYILIISIISHIPNDSLPESGDSFSNLDKVFHFAEFAVLGSLIQSSIRENYFTNPRAVIFTTIIFGLTIACLDELHQSFIKGRNCSVDDLLFDFLGIMFSFFYFKISF